MIRDSLKEAYRRCNNFVRFMSRFVLAHHLIVSIFEREKRKLITGFRSQQQAVNKEADRSFRTSFHWPCACHKVADGLYWTTDIQITALTRALGIHTRILYLDQSSGENVEMHEFEAGSEEKLACALLYRTSLLNAITVGTR